MHTATTTNGRERARRRRLPGLALLGCAAALAACGASNRAAQTSGPRNYNQAVKFATCMRTHGVPTFPDPTPGGGIQFSARAKISPFSPAFKNAQHACQHLLPGGLGPGRASAQDMARFLALSRCMRAHGVTGFPDPVNATPSSRHGFSVIFGRPGAVIEVPSTIDVRAPAFRRAAAACGFPGLG